MMTHAKYLKIYSRGFRRSCDDDIFELFPFWKELRVIGYQIRTHETNHYEKDFFVRISNNSQIRTLCFSDTTPRSIIRSIPSMTRTGITTSLLSGILSIVIETRSQVLARIRASGVATSERLITRSPSG